jgi:hypothetical protein
MERHTGGEAFHRIKPQINPRAGALRPGKRLDTPVMRRCRRRAIKADRDLPAL